MGLYAAGFRFGEVHWQDGRPVDLLIEPDGPTSVREGLGIRAPNMAALAAHRATLAKLGAIPVLDIDAPACDLHALVGLTNVESLWLACRAGDLSPLRELPRLLRLRFKRPSVLWQRDLGSLPDLRVLEIHGHIGPRGPLTLAWLRSFPGLEFLALSSATNRSIDLGGLREVPQLRALRLSGFTLTDLRPLADLSGLRDLVIARSFVRSFHGLHRPTATPQLALELPDSTFSASELARLVEREPHISVAVPPTDPPPPPAGGHWAMPEDGPVLPSPLHEAGFRRAHRVLGQNFLELDIAPNPLPRVLFDTPVIIAPDMTAVARFHKQLARFSHIAALLIDTSVTDLSPVVGLDNIAGLWIYSIDADLAPLRTLPRLSRLFIRMDSIVHDPNGFGPLPHLRTLAIYGYIGPNDVRLSLDWLRGMPQLERLYLAEGTGRTLDLAALASLPRLRELFLNDFRLTDLSPVARLPAVEHLELTNCEIASLRGLVPFDAPFLNLRLVRSKFPPQEPATLTARSPRLTVTILPNGGV